VPHTVHTVSKKEQFAINVDRNKKARARINPLIAGKLVKVEIFVEKIFAWNENF
jgi:hypothetical protein